MRITVLALLFALLISSVSADIQSGIKGECSESEVPVISISDPQETYSHASAPDYYDQNLCISGIESSELTEDECDSSAGFYLTGTEDEAHFSVFDTYRVSVCTDSMETRVTSDTGSCNENETALFSVSGNDNAHVADTDVFDQKVCGSYITPGNVSLSLEFNHSSTDQVYFDGEQVSGEESFDSAGYPYMVSEGDGMVSGIVTSKFGSASRNIQGENILTVSTSETDSSFIVPYTEGDRADIENREEMIENNEFLGEVKPSFGYLLPESPTIRVIYDPEVELNSSIRYTPGSYQFDVVKTGENRIGLLTPDERTGN
ncbi:MAG: hypothetical protein ACI8Z7_000847 [Candidatus Nanohaloarchaea archaeon]|jgi:hypothetical protein